MVNNLLNHSFHENPKYLHSKNKKYQTGDFVSLKYLLEEKELIAAFASRCS